MLFPTKSLSILAMVAGSVLALPATAQEEADLGTVVATVNGTDITLGHMLALRSTLPQQYDQYPPEALFTGLRDDLINQTLLMQKHEGEPSQTNKLRMENNTRSVIASEVMQKLLEKEVTEEDLKAAYDEKYSEEVKEYNAAHILVETEEAAQDVIKKLEENDDFAKAAKEFSIGPSAETGGDLGWFGPGVMVETFFNAVTELEPGSISEPVKSDFGWHVIKLNDTRIAETPPLEDVRAELNQELRSAAVTELLENLESEAEIEEPDISEIDPAVINNLELLEN